MNLSSLKSGNFIELKILNSLDEFRNHVFLPGFRIGNTLIRHLVPQFLFRRSQLFFSLVGVCTLESSVIKMIREISIKPIEF